MSTSLPKVTDLGIFEGINLTEFAEPRRVNDGLSGLPVDISYHLNDFAGPSYGFVLTTSGLTQPWSSLCRFSFTAGVSGWTFDEPASVLTGGLDQSQNSDAAIATPAEVVSGDQNIGGDISGISWASNTVSSIHDLTSNSAGGYSSDENSNGSGVQNRSLSHLTGTRTLPVQPEFNDFANPQAAGADGTAAFGENNFANIAERLNLSSSADSQMNGEGSGPDHGIEHRLALSAQPALTAVITSAIVNDEYGFVGKDSGLATGGDFLAHQSALAEAVGETSCDASPMQVQSGADKLIEPGPSGDGSSTAVHPVGPALALGNTPALSVTWNGVTESQAGGFTPPDCNIAAGLNNIITVVNDHIDIYDKAGANLIGESLNDFFGVSSSNFVFDPRAMWDQFSNRFIVVADDQTGANSNVHIAVSIDSNPLDGWYNYDFNFKSGNNYIDYPIIGIDSSSSLCWRKLF